MHRLTLRVIVFALCLASFFNVAGQLVVTTMPSNDVNIVEGNAIINEPIDIWGSVYGGTPPYTYHLLVNGSEISMGSVSDGFYIGTNYLFVCAGKSTVTLNITDAIGNSASNSSSIQVYADPPDVIKVNMRIEKGLLYLYRNRLTFGTNMV